MRARIIERMVLALLNFLKENSFYIHTHRISTTNIPIILVQNVDFKCIEDLLANSDKAELTISLDDKEIRNTKVSTKGITEYESLITILINIYVILVSM